MSTQAGPVYVVSVDTSASKAKEVTGKVVKALEKEYNLVHVANCESIGVVKHVLTSLVSPPGLLIISGKYFDEETEEVREIAKRVLPEIHLIVIPNDLKEGSGDDKLVTHLKERIEDSRIATRG